MGEVRRWGTEWCCYERKVMSEMPQGGKMAQPADVTGAAREGRCGTIPGRYMECHREVRGADVPVTSAEGTNVAVLQFGPSQTGPNCTPPASFGAGKPRPGKVRLASGFYTVLSTRGLLNTISCPFLFSSFPDAAMARALQGPLARLRKKKLFSSRWSGAA